MRTFIFFTLLFIIFACSEKQSEVPELSKKQNEVDQTTKQQRPNDFLVEKLDEGKLEKLIKQRNGKVLFLNVWATWCVPCKEEFPDLVKLAKEYENSNVEFIGLSVDYPDEVESKIVPFLKQMQTNFPIFVRNFKDDQEFINRLNKNWSGAIPATFIFDANGKQRTFLVGKQSYENFQREIEKVGN